MWTFGCRWRRTTRSHHNKPASLNHPPILQLPMNMTSPVRIPYATLRDDPHRSKAPSRQASARSPARSASSSSRVGARVCCLCHNGARQASRCAEPELTPDVPPAYPAARTRLLRLAATLAALPDDEKARLESPETTYSFGWSHGKEVMNGVSGASLLVLVHCGLGGGGLTPAPRHGKGELLRQPAPRPAGRERREARRVPRVLRRQHLAPRCQGDGGVRGGLQGVSYPFLP